MSSYPFLKVNLLMYGRRPQQFYDIPETVRVYLPQFEFDLFPRAMSMFKTIRFIRDVLRSVKPDAVLNFGERWNNLMLVSALGTGVPVVVGDRSSPAKPLGRIHEPLRKVLYRRSSGIIVQTSEAGELMRGIVKDKVPIHVIPNPLFRLPATVPAKRQREVLFVGRFIPTKHVDRLIRAFGRVRSEDWRLTIVGDDAQGFSERLKLEGLVQSLGLEANVELVGIQKDVGQFYRRASIFAFPSSSEGFPNALAEALSFGLPSVAYDCSAGPSDLIQDGSNGFLVPVFDDDGFANRLQSLIGDAELRRRMSERAVASVAHLDKERIALDFLKACNIPRENLFAAADAAGSPQ